MVVCVCVCVIVCVGSQDIHIYMYEQCALIIIIYTKFANLRVADSWRKCDTHTHTHMRECVCVWVLCCFVYIPYTFVIHTNTHIFRDKCGYWPLRNLASPRMPLAHTHKRTPLSIAHILCVYLRKFTDICMCDVWWLCYVSRFSEIAWVRMTI